MWNIYRCGRCRTGCVGKEVQKGEEGFSVQVFICRQCRYASLPGSLVAEEQGEEALPARYKNGMVPITTLVGPGVEALEIEEIFRLLGMAGR